VDEVLILGMMIGNEMKLALLGVAAFGFGSGLLAVGLEIWVG
jgi:hypothetical protein